MPEAVRRAFRLPSLLLQAIILWGALLAPTLPVATVPSPRG